ncbi:MAG TPA: dTDP-4-dehydrorhamnose 3,5-epimerase family protein [Chloroflexota bacterium]|nr:dTDP-4-dehydrorhamnose 3,5-epimerase family protein [Chloroflexota bacterium]
MQPLDASALGDAYRRQLSTQDYAPVKQIDGVEILQLRQMMDDGGDFMEVARVSPEGELLARPGMRVSQVNYSRVLPGAVKAFHLHFNQEDVWFVPPTDRLLVGLLDVRQDSPTYEQRMRLVLGGGQTRMLYIPRGVAHGVANLWQQPAVLMYFVNQQFSLDEPDERRLPSDLCGPDFWSIHPG